MYELAPKDWLSQGDIVAGLGAHGYEGVQTYGVILTARCDFSQQKADVINYVPAVPLAEWYRRDGWKIPALEEETKVRNQFEAEAASRIKSGTLEIDHVRNSLTTYGGVATLKLLRSSGFASEGRIRTLGERFDELRRSLAQGARPKEIAGQQIASYLKRLQKHGFADLYFLPFEFLGETEVACAHVALLRQIYALPIAALREASGVAAIQLDETATVVKPPMTSNPDLPFGRVARLRSPYTEHFLQRATMLFARIGVTDVHFADIDAVAEALV